jgi:hypothetical protein
MTLMTHVSRPLVALLVGTVLFFALWIVAFKPSSSSSGGTPSGQGGVGQYQSAINSAKSSVKAQNQQSATAGNVPEATTTPAASSSTPAASPSTPAASPSTPGATSSTPAASTTTPAQRATHARATHHRAAAHQGETGATHNGQTVAAHKSTTVAAPKAPSSAPAVHVRGARHRFDVVTTALRDHKVIAILFYNPAGTDDQAVKHELSSIPTYKGGVVKLTVPISELSRYTAITTQVMVSTTPTLVLIDRRHQASLITGYSTGFEIGTLVASALGR